MYPLSHSTHTATSPASARPHPRHLDMKIEELSRCQVAVPHTIDEYPIRSPQTVHSAIAALVKNKDIVEIGTRNGDGMACFAQHARRSVAIEMAPDYCRKLEQRSAALRAATGHNYSVLCSDYTKVQPDADLFTWWQQPPLYNLPVLLHLRRGQLAGHVRKRAKALVLFSQGAKFGKSYNQLLPLADQIITVPFDERDPRCKAYKFVPFQKGNSGMFNEQVDKCYYLAKRFIPRRGPARPGNGTWDIFVIPLHTVDAELSANWAQDFL